MLAFERALALVEYRGGGETDEHGRFRMEFYTQTDHNLKMYRITFMGKYYMVEKEAHSETGPYYSFDVMGDLKIPSVEHRESQGRYAICGGKKFYYDLSAFSNKFFNAEQIDIFGWGLTENTKKRQELATWRFQAQKNAYKRKWFRAIFRQTDDAYTIISNPKVGGRLPCYFGLDDESENAIKVHSETITLNSVREVTINKEKRTMTMNDVTLTFQEDDLFQYLSQWLDATDIISIVKEDMSRTDPVGNPAPRWQSEELKPVEEEKDAPRSGNRFLQFLKQPASTGSVPGNTAVIPAEVVYLDEYDKIILPKEGAELTVSYNPNTEGITVENNGTVTLGTNWKDKFAFRREETWEEQIWKPIDAMIEGHKSP